MRNISKSALLFWGVLLSGCGPSFDPPDQLRSLRILGVEKDLPYAKPGETVNLKMLWEDASLSAGRAVRITWTGPCFDPEGDLYYGCFTPDHAASLLPLTHGDATQFTMPTTYDTSTGAQNLIRNATTENNTPYGIAFVFFAACAGTLTQITPTDPTALPFACVDDMQKPLGSDDFVAGYTSIYSYQSFTNNNPVISGFQFRGMTLDPSAFCGPTLPNLALADQPPACEPIAEATPPDPDSINCDPPTPDPRCVPTCSDDGKKPCPGYAIQPIIEKTDSRNQDQDDVSAMQLGHPTGEQMWIDYYTDGGGFKSPVRLLNDATTGWNDDYGTDFYASKDAKVSRIWALVHDNRGGVAWAGTTIKTQ